MKSREIEKVVAMYICEAEFEFTVAFDYTPDDPGVCSGPPERCYPPEPAEVEVNSISYEKDSGETIDVSWMLENGDFADWLEGEVHSIMESS